MHEINGIVWLDTVEAAAKIGVSPGTLRVWRHEGRTDLPWTKIGPAVVYDAEDVERFARTYRKIR